MRVSVKDLLPGTDYRLQFRANYNGQVTEWSRAYDVTTIADAMPPAVPAGVTWAVNGVSFVATWNEVTTNQDGSPCNDFSHYLIQIDGQTLTKQFKTADEKFELTFEMNRAYFDIDPDLDFKIASVDQTGNQSAWSSTFNAVNPAPSQPANFEAVQAPEAIVLSWDAVTDNDLKEYRVHLDTTSSGFTPSPANLVWSGLSTAFVYQSTAYSTTHYFKLAAVDVFETPSTYAADSATPGSSTGVDTDPPDTPTGLTVTPSMSSNGDADFHIDWTGVGDLDLAGYSVRYRPTDLSEPWIILNVGNDTTEAFVKGLPVAEEFEFQVSAFDFAGNRSSWTGSQLGELANTAPSQPSEPTILSGVQGFAIQHDITKEIGGRLENDVVRLEVWVGAGSPGLQVANLPIEPGSPIVVSELIVYPTTFTTLDVYVRAVDREGLTSSYSNPSTWTVGKLTGTYFEDASINSAKINSLEANKITAGTGIVNNLSVKSQLLIDTGGVVQSADYVSSSGTTGYFLSNNSLIIKSGQIEAAALRLQNGQNLVPLEYADFEFIASYYDNAKFIIPASTTLSIVTANKKYNAQALQVVSASATSRTLDFAPTGAYNVEVDASTPYIASMWVWHNSGSAKSLGIRISWGNGTTSSSSTTSVPNNTWTRISYAATAPAGVSQARVGITFNASYTFVVDGIQVEQQQTGTTTPSQWKPPSLTTIDGGLIRTGEIRSNQTVTVNGVPQPSWSINTQAGAQFGNAVIRGTLIVGATGGSDLDNAASRIQSANYVSNTSGYILRSDGTAELRQLDVNSISITALDRPTQSTLYSNLFDYLEAPDAWVQPDLDPATALTNYLGAQTSNTVLVLDETDDTIRRPGVGVKGVTLDPSAIYRVSATIRSVEATGTVQLSFEAYNVSDVLISEIPIVSVTQTEDPDADYDNNPFGWTAVTGYVKGRGANTVGVNQSTTHDPILLPETTAYVIPKFTNTESAVNTMQIDALVIEAIGVKPNNEIDTGGNVKITIGEPDTDTNEAVPELRIYSGRGSEITPARIYLDETDYRQQIVIAAPNDETIVDAPALELSGSTVNYLPLGGNFYDNGELLWITHASYPVTLTQSSEGYQGHSVTLITTANQGRVYQRALPQSVIKRTFPELVGEEYLTFSAMVKSSISATMGFFLVDNAGVQTGITKITTNPSIVANEWTRVVATYQITGGIIEDFEPLVYFGYLSNQAVGSNYIVSDAMMQRGQVATSFAPYVPAGFSSNGKMGQLPETTFVGPVPDSQFVPRKDLNGRNPRIILTTEDGLQTGMFLHRITNSDDAFFQVGGRINPGFGYANFPAIRMRPVSNDENDALAAGRLEIVTAMGLNSSPQFIAQTINKWFDSTLTPNMPGPIRSQTIDWQHFGHVKIDGNPPWRTVSLASPWLSDGVGVKWYKNNGWLYVRGRVDWGTNDWLPASPPGGQVICTIPGIGGLPYSPFAPAITSSGQASGTMAPASLRISATTGDLTVVPYQGRSEPEAWTNVTTFSNGWVAHATFLGPRYRKVGDTVELEGMLDSGTYGSGNTMFTLPAGYTPSASQSWSVRTGNATTNGIVTINSAGQVIAQAGSGLISINGVRFSTSSTLTAYTPLKRYVYINAAFPLGQDTEYTDPVADFTAPATPTSFTVSPASSGETKGKFRLNWTNPSDADFAGIKLIYKEGTAPTVTINGGPTDIKTLTTNGKIINIPMTSADLGDTWYYYYDNLNVNKTHHFKIVSYDGAGNHSAAAAVSRYLLKSPVDVLPNNMYTYHGGWDTAESCYQGSKGAGYALGHGTMFYGTGIRDVLSPDGVTRNIVELGINLGRSSAIHGLESAFVSIRPHTYQVKPGGAPTVLSAMVTEPMARGEGKYIGVNDSTVLANFASGTYRGIMVYATTTAQYAIFDPAVSWQGRLWIHHTG